VSGTGRDVAKVAGEAYVMFAMPRFLLRAAALIICLAAPAVAEEERWGDMSGAEIRRLLSGNTVTGRYADGAPFSEWHAPDGRVYGHNNRELVDQGCWDMRGDRVCYYYAGGSNRGEFCWEYRKLGDAGVQLRQMSPLVPAPAIAVVQRGNPHGHSDNGKPWTCEPLQSNNSTPRGGHRLAAR
jgi:hypothetical protein